MLSVRVEDGAHDVVFISLTARGISDAIRRGSAGDRGVAPPHLRPRRGRRTRQRHARPRHRAQRGRRERPRAHRRPLWGYRHRRRGGRAHAGIRVLGLHAGRGAGALRLARQRPPVRASPPPAGAVAACRPLRLRPLARHRARADLLADLPGHPDAPPGRGSRPLLPCGEGRRRGVHRRRRGGADAVRVPGRGRDRQRPHAPQRAARPGRPRSPRRDLAGRGRGLRRQDRTPGEDQPRGAADRREPADARPSCRAAPGGHRLPARRRSGGLVARVPAGAAARYRRDGAGRGDGAGRAGRTQRQDAGQLDPDTFRRGNGRIGGGDGAGPRAARRRSSGCGPSSWAW